MEKYKLCALTDSPKITTGFAQPAKEILMGFHESGLFDVFSYGFMDTEPDYHHKLPYSFTPCNELDQLGHKTGGLFLGAIQPDICFIITDPGNLNITLDMITHHQYFGGIGGGRLLRKFPVIAYTPIEGKPTPESHFRAFEKVQRTGGKCVFYTPGAAKMINNEYPVIEGEWAYHGSDHADFQPYEDTYIKHLRHITGFDNKFVVGSLGVNKRTKGFDTLIYTARWIKDMYPDEAKDLVFYFHTSGSKPTMQGYDLIDLARRYRVNDMILFKPEIEKEQGGNIKGINRNTGDFSQSKRPDSPFDRKELFSRFGFIDRLNMLDLYIDLSQAEGWCLPNIEAMACGIPVISVNDDLARKEIYKDGAYFIEPLNNRLWTTWHNGIKLVQVDPKDAADTIIKFKRDSTLRQEYREKGLACAKSYSWQNTKDKFIDIALNILEQNKEKEQDDDLSSLWGDNEDSEKGGM